MNHIASFWQRCVDSIPTACPLCAGAARGRNLCDACYRWITENDEPLPRHGVPGQAPSHARPAVEAGLPAAAREVAVSVRCPRCALRFDAGMTHCPDCSALQPAFAYTIAAFDYVPPFDALILQVKQSGRFGLAATLGGLLADAVARDPRGLLPDTRLIPVPATRPALRQRGFNPAGEIARAVGRRLGLGVLPSVVRVTDDGMGRQRMLSRSARLARAGGRFGLHFGAGLHVQGFPVAVVDDVMTTGSTMHSIAQVLHDAGAARVVALVVARTPASRN